MRAWVLLGAVFFAFPVTGAEGLGGADIPQFMPSPVSIKGFATLGAARTDDGAIQPVREVSQPTGLTPSWSFKHDSLAGLQINAALGPDTEAVLQTVSRYRYDGGFRPEVTWAYLRHDFSPKVTLRLGRLGTEFYMLADSRMIGYSYVTVRPPTDYYALLPMNYFDGADFGASTLTALGVLRGKVFVGQFAEKLSYYHDITWDWAGTFTWGAYCELTRGPWQVRLSKTRLRLKKEQPLNEMLGFDFLGLSPQLPIARTWNDFTALGLAYDSGPLLVQGMLSKINYQSRAFEDTWSGYALAAYRIGEFTPFIGYSRVFSKQEAPSTPLPPDVLKAISAVVAYSHTNQHTVSLGGRWDFRRNMALKAQVDWVRGKPDSLFTSRDETGVPWDGRLSIFSLSLDMVF